MNNTNNDLTDVSFFGFLDMDIDSLANTYFNEYGDASGFMLGLGSGDSAADSWEIDEPQLEGAPLPGNIIDNLVLGALDNINSITPSFFEDGDDVSLALGFVVGTWFKNQTLTATFEISEANNGGLYQYDPDSEFGLYFNGSVSLGATTPVAVPAAVWLFGSGLLGLVGIARRKKA